MAVPRIDERGAGVEREGQGGWPSPGPGEWSMGEEVMARTWREMKRVKGYSEGPHTDWLWRCLMKAGGEAENVSWVSSLSIWRWLAGWCYVGRLKICRTRGGPKESRALLELYAFKVWDQAGGCEEISHWSLECGWYWTKSMRTGCGNVWECVWGEWRISNEGWPNPGGGRAKRQKEKEHRR